MRLPWKTGNNPTFDELLGQEVLELAKGDPNAESSLRNSLELRGAVYAIIEALPNKARKHLTNDTKVDIASVIVLQRAASYQEALLAHGFTAGQAETFQDDDLSGRINPSTEEVA